MGQVPVVGVHVDGGAKEHRAEFSKGFHNTQQLFFNCGVVALSSVEFACVVSYWVPLLFDDGTKLEIAGVGFDVKG